MEKHETCLLILFLKKIMSGPSIIKSISSGKWAVFA